ncbi:MAG: hypothetical protein ACM3X7_08490 [Solirubrobacterales bacterium]
MIIVDFTCCKTFRAFSNKMDSYVFLIFDEYFQKYNMVQNYDISKEKQDGLELTNLLPLNSKVATLLGKFNAVLNNKLMVWKGRIMKKLFLIIGFALILLAGCNSNSDRVTITTDRNSYTPSMSSAQGIKMTPDFETKKSCKNLIYHWKTGEGEFIGMGKEVENQGQAVIWSAVGNGKVVDIKKSFDIKLEIMDGESKKILATTKVTITPNNGFYEIKE